MTPFAALLPGALHPGALLPGALLLLLFARPGAGATLGSGLTRESFSWVELDGDAYRLGWDLPGNDTIDLAFSMGQKGFFGLGLGTDTMAGEAVYCLFDEDGDFTVEDAFMVGVASRPRPDDTLGGSAPGENNLDLIELDVSDDSMFVVLRRPLVTGDRFDASVLLASMQIVYSWSTDDGVANHGLGRRGIGTINFGVGSDAAVFVRDSGDDAARFYRLHGMTMAVTWLVLVPLAIVVVRFFKAYNFWVSLHRSLLTIVITVTLPLVWSTLERGGSFRTAHSYLGAFTALACLAQFLLGGATKYMLKHDSSSGSYRPLRNVHRLVGWGTVGSSSAACYLGAHLLEPEWLLWLRLWFSALCVTVLALETAREVDRRRGPIYAAAAAFPPLLRLLRRVCSADGPAKVYAVNGDGSSADPERQGGHDGTERLFLTLQDVQHQKRTSGMPWLICDGHVYDVGEFARKHPGGAALMRSAYGTDTTAAMAGNGGGVKHAHSSRAYRLLENFRIAEITDDPRLSFVSGGASLNSRRRSVRRRAGGTGKVTDQMLKRMDSACTASVRAKANRLTPLGAQRDDEAAPHEGNCSFFDGRAAVVSSRALPRHEGDDTGTHEVVLALDTREGADVQAHMRSLVHAGEDASAVSLHVKAAFTEEGDRRYYTCALALQWYGGGPDLRPNQVRLFVRRYPGGLVSPQLCDASPGTMLWLSGPFARGVEVADVAADAVAAFAQGTAALAFADLVARFAAGRLRGVRAFELHLSFARERDTLFRDWLDERVRERGDGRLAVRWYVQAERRQRFDADTVLAARTRLDATAWPAGGARGTFAALYSGRPGFAAALAGACREAGVAAHEL